jgi:hypothetical protein
VSGADPIDSRPGFAAMLGRIEGNGVRTIIKMILILRLAHLNAAERRAYVKVNTCWTCSSNSLP